MRPPCAFIFDLDGTLLDTLVDLANSGNEALQRSGFPTHSVEQFRLFIGGGVHLLISRALPADAQDESTIDRCVADFREIYGRRFNETTMPYPRINELLSELTQRRHPLAILSNKPHDFTQQCVASHFAQFTISPVWGQRDGIPKKPSPQAAWLLADRLKVAPNDCIFVGDSEPDMQTATAANMLAVGVTWGFRSESQLREAGAQVVVHCPSELLNVSLPL